MPRTVEEILAHADELAERFEQASPSGPAEVTELGALYRAVQARATAERTITERVRAARAAGFAWTALAMMLGTSPEAARQRYGGRSAVKTPPVRVTQLRSRGGTTRTRKTQTGRVADAGASASRGKHQSATAAKKQAATTKLPPAKQ